MCLHEEGLPTKEIDRRIGASRNAVRRWVRAGRFMHYHRTLGSSLLDRHLSFVEARWREGQHIRAFTDLLRQSDPAGLTP